MCKEVKTVNISPVLPIPVMAIICIGMIALKRKGVWNFTRQIIIAVLIFAINLRPALPTDKIVVVKNDVDVLFVVDNTISMLAEDYGSDDDRRMDAVREDIETIMGEFEGARFGLLTFDDTANYVIPYTSEPDIVLNATQTLEGRLKEYAGGTSLNISYDALKEVLENNTGVNDDDDDDDDDDEDVDRITGEDRIQVVFYISDGEITSGDRLRSFEKISPLIDTGAVLGYGTSQGGQMHVRNYLLGTYELLQYYDSGYNLVTAISKIDEDNLKNIATDLGIGYYHMQNHSDLNEAITAVKTAISTGDFERSDKSGEGKLEVYYILSGALAVFLIYDMIYYRRKLGQER